MNSCFYGSHVHFCATLVRQQFLYVSGTPVHLWSTLGAFYGGPDKDVHDSLLSGHVFDH